MDVLKVREVDLMQLTILGRDDHVLEGLEGVGVRGGVVRGEKAAQVVNSTQSNSTELHGC